MSNDDLNEDEIKEDGDEGLIDLEDPDLDELGDDDDLSDDDGSNW